MKTRILFVCTHNSARSQMAEGLMRHLAGDRFDVASAGTEARNVHPLAVRVMAERGIDISRHNSKTLERLVDERWDCVVTVCDGAREACPVFPRIASRLHWSFIDPSGVPGSEDERLAVFRRVRDQIEDRIAAWLREHSAPVGAAS